MSFGYGPLTDDYGLNITSISDGAGGIILTCDKYGSVTVTAAHLLNAETAQLVWRCVNEQDVESNWTNLVSHLAGIG